MYTPTIVGKFIQDGTLYLDVSLTNGINTSKETFSFKSATADKIKTTLHDRCESLNALSDANDSLDIGVVEKPVKIPKTEEVTTLSAPEVARAEWFSKYSQWQKMKRAIDMKIMDETDPVATDLLAEVRSGFLPEYLTTI